MPIDLSRLRRSDSRDRRSWHGSAFIVEALVLLVFLVASLGVIIQVIGDAHDRGTEADRLSSALVLASNDAEKFASDPSVGDAASSFVLADGRLTEAGSGEVADGASLFDVTRAVQASESDAGTLYEAHIEVANDGDVVYALDTARYVPNEEVRP